MEQKLLGSTHFSLRSAEARAALELAQADLIFIQDLGMVPKHIITPRVPSVRPAAERKWLGADFSHVIVSQ